MKRKIEGNKCRGGSGSVICPKCNGREKENTGSIQSGTRHYSSDDPEVGSSGAGGGQGGGRS